MACFLAGLFMSVKKEKKSILIIAGEASGDVHGAGLVRELKKIRPGLDFFGIGGDGMAAEGVEVVRHVREVSFLGFYEVLSQLPFMRRVFKEMIDLLEKRKPCFVLLIDYPGFNLRFAREAKKRGVSVFYYISPQVWAWGRRRVKKIKRFVDRMVVIFPFEELLYREAGIDVWFVGHPLKDVVRVDLTKEGFFKESGLDSSKVTVGMLPGSRRQEVLRILPEMKEAYLILKGKIEGAQAVIGQAPTVSDDLYSSLLNKDDSIVRVCDRTYEVMAHSDVVMVASGTATLETAILGTPMVILYKMAPITYLLGRVLVRLKQIGLVNIVGGRSVVPELVQRRANGKKIADTVYSMFINPNRRNKMKEDLDMVSRLLGKKGATRRAAGIGAEFLDQTSGK
jgi:lipid-A-disaccharide synthase